MVSRSGWHRNRGVFICSRGPSLCLSAAAMAALPLCQDLRSEGQEGTGSVRFVSVPHFSKIVRFGSVRFGQSFVPVRRGSACVFGLVVARSGSVRFVSTSGSGIKRFGSVWSGRFGSVSYSFLEGEPGPPTRERRDEALLSRPSRIRGVETPSRI